MLADSRIADASPPLLRRGWSAANRQYLVEIRDGLFASPTPPRISTCFSWLRCPPLSAVGGMSNRHLIPRSLAAPEDIRLNDVRAVVINSPRSTIICRLAPWPGGHPGCAGACDEGGSARSGRPGWGCRPYV